MATKTELQTRIVELEAEQARAEMLYQISHNLNTACDEDELLQILARPAREAGAFRASLMYTDLNEANEPEWVEIVAAWQKKGPPSVPVGSRFYSPEMPFSRLWLASPDKPQFITDVAAR